MKKLAVLILISFLYFSGEARTVAYDIDQAKEMCADLPLEAIEGIWIYPEDNVTVTILNSDRDYRGPSPAKYEIRVVSTEDCRLRPGDCIGYLQSSPKDNTYSIELFTEKRNDLLLKPRSCVANLNKNGDRLLFKKSKSKLKTRLNLNFSRLLPGFWKMISTGVSSSPGSGEEGIPAGMIKVYPSYDGNGSSMSRIIYL